MDDAKLYSLLINNPAEGLRTAITLYGSIAKAVVVRVLGCNHPEIEECIADTFVKLWKNAASAEPSAGGGMKSYIAAIARNTAIDTYRKTKVKPLVVPLEDDAIGFDFNIEDEYVRSANAQIIKESVDSLPEPERTIFFRRYYFSERVKDIASSVGMDAKKVENILYRGKKKLERNLLERGIM